MTLVFWMKKWWPVTGYAADLVLHFGITVTYGKYDAG